MKLTTIFYLAFSVAFLPYTVSADTIYKSVDESGATIFSDQRTPDAEKIKIQPNVVDVNIPDIPLSAPAKTRKPTVRYTGTQSNTRQDDTIEIGSGTTNAGNIKRRVRNYTSGEGINRPVTRPAARSGGRR